MIDSDAHTIYYYNTLNIEKERDFDYHIQEYILHFIAGQLQCDRERETSEG